MDIKEFAKLANTSVATVSRVVNHKPGVSAKRRREIELLIKEHGYIPNPLGRALASKNSFIVGVLLESLDNPYYAEVLAGIENFLSKSDYSLQLYCSQWQRETQQWALQCFKKQQVDGILAFPLEKSLPDFAAANAEIPLILLDYEPPQAPWNFVSTNNVQGGFEVAQYLVNNGHKNIYIIDSHNHQSSNNRIKGFLSYVESPAIRAHVCAVVGKRINCPKEAETLIEYISTQEFTAIFCVNDLAALYAIEALEKHGIHVPQDISVFGYDDLAISRYYRVPISTVSQAKRMLGELAARELLWQLENGRRKYRLKLQPELVIRQSTIRISEEK